MHTMGPDRGVEVVATLEGDIEANGAGDNTDYWAIIDRALVEGTTTATTGATLA